MLAVAVVAGRRGSADSSGAYRPPGWRVDVDTAVRVRRRLSADTIRGKPECLECIRLWCSTGFGAAKVSSRGQDSPKLLERSPTPSPLSPGLRSCRYGSLECARGRRFASRGPPHDRRGAPLDLRREIAGSVDYIERELCPPGKRVQIFLWSGNCRPWPEALRLVRELGIENMNGGETAMSRKRPSVSRVSARALPWEGELQITSANENENIYRERWAVSGDTESPFYGGFLLAAAYSRAKSGKHPAYALHLLYWHMPAAVTGLKRTPPSYLREMMG